MQILSIQLKNIKSHRDLKLRFAPGINVLAGPNGIGKSTIFEAIGYALFGVDAQSFVGNVDRFLSIGAKKGEISLVFEVDAGRFKVSRSVGTPSRWLLAKEVGDAFEVEEHKDGRETEERLKELLGLDNGRPLAEQYELVIGPFQHDFLGPFVIRQPTRRRDRFDEILGIDSWRKTFSQSKPLLKAIQNRIERLKDGMAPLQARLAELPKKREELKATQQQRAATVQQFTTKDRELHKVAKQLGELDRLEKKIETLSGEIGKLRERTDNGKEKITRQNVLIDEAEKAQKVVDANRAGHQAYGEAERRRQELRKQVQEQRALEQKIAELDKRQAELTAQLAAERQSIERTKEELDREEQQLSEKRQALTLDDEVRKLAARLPEIRAAIDRLRSRTGELDGRRLGLEEGREKLAEGTCPFFQEPCLNLAGNPPGDLFAEKFAALDDERRTQVARLSQLEQEEARAIKACEALSTFEAQSKALEEQRVNLAAKRKANQERSTGLATLLSEQNALAEQVREKRLALEPYATLQADIEATETELKQHQAARDLYLANLEQAGRLEGLKSELQTFERFLVQLQEELAAKEADLQAATRAYAADRHQHLREQKDALGREVGALGQKIEGLKAEERRLIGEIDQLKQIEQQIAAKQAEIEALGEKETLIKFLRNQVFRNVSAYLSERFREEISQRADRIYRTIAETDEELLWGENYRIILRDMVDGNLRERSDDQLSGGQIMSAVVALRLALLQTIGARIAFFDEPTSNLDADRRENLARAFRAIDVGQQDVTEHWYDQLFLISHDVAFTEVTDQIIDFEQDRKN